MNALLPRDQATLPKACLGSLIGPMFARLVLLLALSPVGKLEATRWKHLTTGSFQSCVPRPTFPTSSNVTVPASETSSRTCSVSSNNMIESSQKADCIYLYTATSGETASVQTCELLLALTYGLQLFEFMLFFLVNQIHNKIKVDPGCYKCSRLYRIQLRFMNCRVQQCL